MFFALSLLLFFLAFTEKKIVAPLNKTLPPPLFTLLIHALLRPKQLMELILWRRKAKLLLRLFQQIENSPLPLKEYPKASYSLNLPPLIHNALLRSKLLLTYPPQIASATRWQQTLHDELIRQRLALRYRLDTSPYGLMAKKENSNEKLQQLRLLARKWKQRQPHIECDKLTSKEEKLLKKSSSYRFFIDLLFYSDELQEIFFSWLLRDLNPPEVFIQYPYICQRLLNIGLSQRLNRTYKEALKIVVFRRKSKSNHPYPLEKSLFLLIENEYVDLVNRETKVCLKGKWELTVGQILHIFDNKKFEVGHLEVMAQGVTNWNSHLLGYWDKDEQRVHPIDIDQEEWWLQLPLLTILTQQQARKRFGIALDGKVWAASATSTRGTKTMDYDNSHSFLELGRPLSDGRYALYQMGKFALTFPKSFLEATLTFCCSTPATIAYPDENTFYTHREHTHHSFVITPEQAEKMMLLIKEDIKKARAGNFIYQIESENCAKWVQLLLQKVLGHQQVPNMFITSLLESEPQNRFVAFLFETIRRSPKSWQLSLLTGFHFLLGAWRGVWIVENGKKVWKSLTCHPFWESGIVYLPAFLHKQRNEGLLFLTNGASKEGLLLRLFKKSLRAASPAPKNQRHNLLSKVIRFAIGEIKKPSLPWQAECRLILKPQIVAIATRE